LFEHLIPLVQRGGLALDCVVVRLDAQQRPNARQQLDVVDRFGDEVVRARVERPHFGLLVAGRDHDDRQQGRGRVGPQPPADLVAVQARHHDVQQDQVGLPLGDEIEGVLAG
jgi:hypothetical protein